MPIREYMLLSGIAVAAGIVGALAAAFAPGVVTTGVATGIAASLGTWVTAALYRVRAVRVIRRLGELNNA